MTQPLRTDRVPVLRRWTIRCEMAPGLTEFAVHFDETQLDVESRDKGPSIELGTVDATGNFTPTFAVRPVILAKSKLPEGFELPRPPSRPVCLVSIHNDF